MRRLQAIENTQFGSVKNCLKYARTVYTNTLVLFYLKKRLEKTANIRKMRAFRKGLKMATMQRPCKIFSLGQKIKLPETFEKRFYNHIRVVPCKRGSRKQLIFEKRDRFENGQNWP